MKPVLVISYLLLMVGPGVPGGSVMGEAVSIPVRFKAPVTVMTTTYTVGDVVDIEGSAEQRRSLGELVLGRSPRPGQQAHVRRADVLNRINRHAPELALSWHGDNRTLVRAAGRPYTDAILVKRAQAHLEDWLQGRFPTATVKPVPRRSRTIVLPEGRVEVQPRLANAARLSARMSVWVDISVEGAFFQALPLWFAVEALAPVLKTRRDLPAHHAPSAADVRRELVDLATLGTAPLPLDALRSLRLKRSLREGAVLLREDMELAPAVSKGQLITVYARHGAVAVKVQGKATADGNIAESIAVENPDTGVSYYAIVIDKGVARVN